MHFLNDWILNIIIFLLLAMVIDMLLPDSNMKKYSKLVTGLLLMGIILTPIFKLLSSDFEAVIQSVLPSMETEMETQESLLEKKKREIQASMHAYTLEQMAVLMEADVEKEMMEKFDIKITSIHITADADVEPTMDQLKSVKVSIAASDETISAVIPVTIDLKESPSTNIPTDYTSILETLSARWEIPVSILEIVPKGGTEEKMDNKNGPLDWIKKKLTETPPGNKNGKQFYLIIVLLAGAAFMLIGNLGKKDNLVQPVASNNGNELTETFKQKESDKTKAMKIFEEQYENQLKEALDQIVGVNNVTVVVTVESTESRVHEKNNTLKKQTTSEGDKNGGTRQIEDQSHEEQLVIVRDGDKEVPIITETRAPEVKGVLVVAGGAENIQVRKWIIEAVTRTLNIPSHKLAVIPKKSKGDS